MVVMKMKKILNNEGSIIVDFFVTQFSKTLYLPPMVENMRKDTVK